MSPVNEQPMPTIMNATKRSSVDRTVPCDPVCHMHKSCHYTRLRRLVIPTFFVLLTIVTLLFVSFSEFDSGLGAAGGLFRRTINTNGSSPGFVKNKLYLIVVFVGLVLVLMAGFALAFWCCKGAFENPCCCPCYLCACCGGLACLECISCGLCAEGIEDLNV